MSKMFFDKRCAGVTSAEFYSAMESYGDRAIEMYRRNDGKLAADKQSFAGPLEDSSAAVGGLIPAVLSWAACSKLAMVSDRVGEPVKAHYWARQAEELRESIVSCFYNNSVKSFSLTQESPSVDASVFSLWKFGLLPISDEKMMSTLLYAEAKLLQPGVGVRRVQSDKVLDYAATFDWVRIQVSLGKVSDARKLFESVLQTGRRNGMTFSEKWDPNTGEMWGNLPSTTAMASLIDCAIALGPTWTFAA